MKRLYSKDDTCSVEGCDRPPKVRGWCGPHHLRWLRTGDVRAGVPLAPRSAPCRVAGCEKPARGGRLCNMHYDRRRRHGDENWEPSPRPRKPRVDAQGYVQVWIGQRYELQHRLVWQEAHGPLLPGQNIHHKNGQRDDNRIENLEVWDVSQPAGQRVEDKVAFAVEMLRRYAPHLLK